MKDSQNSSSPIRISGMKQSLPSYFDHLNLHHLDLDQLNIPTQMNPKDRCATIELSKQYMRISYQGSGKTDSDAASVRSKNFIPPQVGIFYFEVSITSKGRDGYIGIGFCSGNVSLQRLPGWEPNSWGYHGDDGNSFNCTGTGKKYGPTFTTNDVIGCGINFAQKSAFFTKNGLFLGNAFENIALDSVQVYPCIGLRTPGETVEINFGKKNFSFDIISYIDEQREALESLVFSKYPSFTPHDLPLNLIIKHMLFNGYIESAKELMKSLGNMQLSKQDSERCELKSKIQNLLACGNYEELLNTIQFEFTGIDDVTIFHIKCQKFVELVQQAFTTYKNEEMVTYGEETTPRRRTRSSSRARSSSVASSNMMVIDGPEDNNNHNNTNEEYERIKHALDYGQQLQDEYRNDEREFVQQKLIEIFSLLAYPNPLEVPSVNHLFEKSQKMQLFDMLNVELFGEDDVLRKNMKQLHLVMSEMQECGDGNAALISFGEDEL